MVPSLVSCCLKLLVPFANEIQLPVALRIRPHDTLLDDLVPDPAQLDPKLWAVLVQVYDALPPYFRSLTLPLASPDVSLVQNLTPTPNFSLITLLNLSSCSDLTDETIILFKGLHTLVGFDASCTNLTSHAIYTLGAILQHDYEEDALRRHRGPWELRILSLRGCKQINDDVYPILDKFPLLSVVDLRGTSCTHKNVSSFGPCPVSTFFHPISMSDAISELQLAHNDLFLTDKPYMLKVDKLKLPEARQKHVPNVAPRDAFVVIPANPFLPVKVGNTNVLEMQKQLSEEREKHERNKEAWYERQERIEERQFGMTVGDFVENDRDDSSRSSRTHNFTSSTLAKELKRLRLPRLHPSRLPTYNASTNSSAPTIIAASESNTASSRPDIHIPEHRRPMSFNPPPRATANVTSRPVALHTNQVPGVAAGGPSSAGVLLAPSTSTSTASFYLKPLKPPPPLPMRKPKPLLMQRVESGDLKLYREPPPYSSLSSALAQAGSSKQPRPRASTDQVKSGDASTSATPSTDSLKQTAQVDQTGTRAERARHAMQLAVQSRMLSVASSRSETSIESSDAASVLKKRRNVVPSFESSFPLEDAPTRSRNPFRKSLPSQSAMSGFLEPPDFDSPSTSKPHLVPESKGQSKKAAHRHSLSISTSASTFTNMSPPRLRPSKSVTELRSSEFSVASTSTSGTNKVGYRPAPRPPSPPNTKPLVPISSIQIPILPEPLRKEVAAMEKAEIAKIQRAAERKRKKRAAEEAADATDEDEEELKRALKKRASMAKIGAGAKNAKEGDGGDAGGRATDAPTAERGNASSSAKGKGKGKAGAGKKSAFDWKGWSKKG